MKKNTQINIKSFRNSECVSSYFFFFYLFLLFCNLYVWLPLQFSSRGPWCLVTLNDRGCLENYLLYCLLAIVLLFNSHKMTLPCLTTCRFSFAFRTNNEKYSFLDLFLSCCWKFVYCLYVNWILFEFIASIYMENLSFY